MPLNSVPAFSYPINILKISAFCHIQKYCLLKLRTKNGGLCYSKHDLIFFFNLALMGKNIFVLTFDSCRSFKSGDHTVPVMLGFITFSLFYQNAL